MDIKTRAILVRQCRMDLKQLARGVDPWDARDPDSGVSRSKRGPHSSTVVVTPRARNRRSRIEMARTRSRFQRVRPGETADQYIGRTAEGGDSSYGAAAARYDLRRGRGSARATPWNDGYTSYGGNPAAYQDRRRLRASAADMRPRTYKFPR